MQPEAAPAWMLARSPAMRANYRRVSPCSINTHVDPQFAVRWRGCDSVTETWEMLFLVKVHSFPPPVIRIPRFRTAVKEANIYYKSSASGNIWHLFFALQTLNVLSSHIRGSCRFCWFGNGCCCSCAQQSPNKQLLIRPVRRSSRSSAHKKPITCSWQSMVINGVLDCGDIPFPVVDTGLFPGKEPTGSWAPLCEQRAPGRPSGCHSWSRDTQLSL